jgi:hypothetical protein
MIRLVARLASHLASGLSAALLLTAPALSAEPAAPPAEDPSVVVAPNGSAGDVVNGSAYDRGEIDLGAVKHLTVPADAEVVQEGTGTTVRLFTRKTLSFAGHPPEKMHIRTARNNLGIATQGLADGLVIGTFGEFWTKEGGAQLKLRVVVPQGIAVEKRTGLSGDSSKVHAGSGVKPRDPKNGYWYGPTGPSDGWTIMKTMADGERTLAK